MIDEWYPDSSVNCALPDLRYVFYIGVGAVVIAAALGIAVLRRLRGA